MAWQLVKDGSRDNPFRHYYQRLLRGNPAPKAPKVALGHVASKLVTVMYVCMRRASPTIRLASGPHGGATHCLTGTPH